MPTLQFSLNLPVPNYELIKLVTNYENLKNYMPKQLQSLKILEQSNNETVTEETVYFKTLKTTITQETVHRRISENQLEWEIKTGPVKGTVVKLLFEKDNYGTKVSIDADLKLGLKLKIFSPLIQKEYKKVLTGILYKMNTEILNQTSN